jgi:cytochrome o ubiquinol oxidase subunit 2
LSPPCRSPFASAACSIPSGLVVGSEKLILLDSLGIRLVIVVPVIFATFAFAWWFRAGTRFRSVR